MLLWLATAAGAALSLTAWWFRRSYRIVSIAGLSMLPTYEDGDRVVARRRGARRLRVGDVVVFSGVAGGGDFTVKRVAALPGDPMPDMIAAVRDDVSPRVPPGRLAVLGDNPALSLDSRQLGLETLSGVYGVVLRPLRTSRRRRHRQE